MGKDGSSNHAITVVNDLVFDSTQPRAMKLKMETLDWICGKGGINYILEAFRFEHGWKQTKKLVLKPSKNW